MPVTPITDLGTAVTTGLAAAFAGFMLALPSVIGALLLLAIGWIIAGAIGGVLAVLYGLKTVSDLSRLWLGYWFAAGCGGFALWRSAVRLTALRGVAAGRGHQRVEPRRPKPMRSRPMRLR